jgi:photosystem II stability/assembly factor-like uncharacterized protein
VNRNLGRLVSEDVLYVTSVYDGDFGGLFATLDRGLTWALTGNQDALLGKNIISLAVAPQDPAQLIAGSYDGLLRSSDRGKTWKVVDTFSAETRSGRIYDVAFSRVDPGTIYVATDHGLFKTTNGGISWQRNPAKELDSPIYKLSIDPADARTMMIHTSSGVLISRDSEGRWDPVNFGKNTVVYDFALASGPQRRIVAASSRGLLYSEDGGLNWNVVEGGLPAMRLDQILLVPNRPEELYVLSRDNHQMWQSTNAGREWVRLDTGGLEGASLRFMTVVSDQPFVVTENHGVFRLDARSDISHLLGQAP